MISIRRYIDGDGVRTEGTLRRAFAIVLEAVEANAVEVDHSEDAQFRTALQQLSRAFSDTTPPEEALVIAGGVSAMLKDHADRMTRHMRAQSAEYHRMVSMLTDAVAVLSQENHGSVHRLRDIEKQLQQACAIEDVRTLRLRLSECLDALKSEVKAQAGRAAEMTAEFRRSMDISRERLGDAAALHIDPVTQLPDRIAAEHALEEAAARRRVDAFLVVIVANRIQAINSKFGFSVGDRVLQHVRDEVRASLSADDRLFRWRGPTLAALLLRAARLDNVREEISRIADEKGSAMIDVGGHSALLAITFNWCVFPVTMPVRSMLENVDHFVASQVPHPC